MDKNIIFREATLADVEELHDLERLCFSSDRISMKKYKKFISNKKAKVYVLLDVQKKTIIGSAVLLFQNKNPIVRLYSFAVSPEYRGTGASKHFFNEIQKRINTNKTIILEVSINNEPAIAFYKDLGFVNFGFYKKYYQDGSAALRMKKIAKEVV